MSNLNLLVGTSVVDITPPLEVGLLTSAVNGLYAPFEFVRLPLKARVLVIRSETLAVAIVALDLLLLNDTSVGGWEIFKRRIAGDFPPEKIIICCTHTHTAPESGALTGLYLSKPYQEWLTEMQTAIADAILKASRSSKFCNMALSSCILEGFSMQRRIKTPNGIIMSDSIQPIPEELLNLPPVDRRVKSIYIQDNQGGGIATVVQSVCHAVHEMCLPHVSSEFPGEMCNELEKSTGLGMPIFLNGAAGDTNPPTVSMGPQCAQKHGIALARLVQNPDHKEPLDTSVFAFVYSKIQLPLRTGSTVTNELQAMARFSAVRIGDLAILFLPGEPFIETALEIEACSPFKWTIIVGYSENSIGYIPTEKAFELGGYEIGPGKWSFLEKGTDRIIATQALQLLNELHDK